MCGPLTYDGHKGTDFRVLDHDAFVRGIPVQAASAGHVLRIRDGMDDVRLHHGKKDPRINKREAGNAVLIRTAEGTLTLYAHLRKGSIRVSPGDEVQAGEILGFVGLSGLTEFPHLHFEVRRDETVIDPFVGTAPSAGCGNKIHEMWTPEVANQLHYQAGGLLDAGFGGDRPNLASVLYEEGGQNLPTNNTLSFWVATWGIRRGDRERIELSGPGVTAQNESTIKADKAQWFRYIQPTARPAHGTYTGRYRLWRQIENSSILIVDVTRTWIQ